MYSFLFIISLLLIHKTVYGIVDLEENSVYYETNFLKSDLKRYKIKSCSTDSDCPEYAYCKNYGNFNYCDFKFHCRTDYACILEIPNDVKMKISALTNTEEVNKTTATVHEFSVDTKNKYQKNFVMGNTVGLKMLSSVSENNYCSHSCKDSSDCYSENCVGECCLTSDIKEFICGPREKELSKAKNITDLENTKIVCKSSINQNCSKDDDCFSNKCDYSGICVETDYIQSEKKKYDNEVRVFYVFIVLIIVLISSVLLCSLYFGRRVSKPGKGKRKHLLDD